MTYSVPGYDGRASECVRLAGLTYDEMVRTELLKLRQAYLLVAQRLREHDFEQRATHSAG